MDLSGSGELKGYFDHGNAGIAQRAAHIDGFGRRDAAEDRNDLTVLAHSCARASMSPAIVASAASIGSPVAPIEFERGAVQAAEAS